MQLKDRLNEAISASGITKKELSAKLGISASAITYWTNGKTNSIDGANLLAAAIALKVNPQWLATGEGSRDTAVPIQLITKDPILDDLAALLPEDADVWRAQIRAAATKARRAKEEKRERQQDGVADPPLISRRVSSM